MSQTKEKKMKMGEKEKKKKVSMLYFNSAYSKCIFNTKEVCVVRHRLIEEGMWLMLHGSTPRCFRF